MTETNDSGRGRRDLRIKVKTAKGRKLSSTLWLERQLNDPYVTKAKREGYRGRAAYKIMELDDKYGFFKPGARVVDLGCAPGGWCQVAVPRVNALGEKANKPIGTVLGVDLQEIEPIAGCELHQLDFLAEDADGLVKGWLGGKADVVLSDMAASASGHKGTDHLRIIALVEAATSGDRRFFLGTDSAPHDKSAKESACGCAGIFNAPFALESYAAVFEEEGALDKFEAFASENGPRFYGLPLNEERIILERTDIVVPELLALEGLDVVPFHAGETLHWRLKA